MLSLALTWLEGPLIAAMLSGKGGRAERTIYVSPKMCRTLVDVTNFKM